MSAKPRGPITTLLDLTDRDLAENDLFPLDSETTWFTRDPDRATVTFTPQVQRIFIRGPTGWGQRFTFDLDALQVGDLLMGAVLQLEPEHWLDPTTQLQLGAGTTTYADPTTAWEFANSLGSVAVAKAELEIDGKTVETIDGDFTNVFAALSSDFNAQVGMSYDAYGRVPIPTLRGLPPRLYPTEDGYIHCYLPFFFGRTKYQEALPMIAMRAGLTRVHITLRPFTEVVRQARGFRDNCDSVPLGATIPFTGATGTVETAQATPGFKSVSLLCYSAVVDGELRQKMLREPFEQLHREVQTFVFDEPLKYMEAKTTQSDTIRVQLPLEANHPVEEILWFVRRKGVRDNNEWTNYSDTLEVGWPSTAGGVVDPQRFLAKPLLVSAALRVNGIPLVEAEEEFFRSHIAAKHKGGFAAYSRFMYGWSFAETPGAFQPSGSANMSRANSLRLTLEVRPPVGGGEWEVKVFCVALNWMRYENGLAGAVFED